jgi:CO/xanthine dehydrogenase Mo-binding subunit
MSRVLRTALSRRRPGGQGTFSFRYPDDLPGELGPGTPYHVFCYGAQVAAVEVDRELGTVRVKDMVAIQDLGRAIARRLPKVR